ncbi:hypothetical protein ABT263_02630 [Kitasatospora sp. NPDC001603]|uniref:hypothetical protein n=1 Tax=Kitasatospora sp. NPDC001603 TaxID=3154388 RepID=UPI00331A53D2
MRTPGAELRRELLNAYLRVHNSLSQERRCRHLAALLADEITGGGATPELADHLADCRPCTRAAAELRAIHHWDVAVLQKCTLLRPWGPTPQKPIRPDGTIPVDPPERPPGPPGRGEPPTTPGATRTRRATSRARRGAPQAVITARLDATRSVPSGRRRHRRSPTPWQAGVQELAIAEAPSVLGLRRTPRRGTIDGPRSGHRPRPAILPGRTARSSDQSSSDHSIVRL